ncbi:hypothetical protein ACP4OV_011657 [Aristida adscensionis]
MEIVTGAISTLLPKLAKLLSNEYKLQRSLRGEIMFLKAELESMQAALERMSEAPVTDKQDRIWARDVRDLSYDIEDSIDKYMVHIATNQSAKPRGFGGFIHRSLRLLTTANLRHTISTEIISIKVLVSDVASRRGRYKIENSSFVRPATTTIDPRLIGMYEETMKLVGINGPREEVTKLLMEPEATLDDRLNVISIVGVGGLGKTTLANAVYQQLRGQFQCHAFVSVSLAPDLKRILSSILRQVSEQDYGSIETWDVEEIINKIRLFLQDKRYIIILDDIWDKSAWAYIKCALVDNNCGSRIITTSRLLDVAASCCSDAAGAVYHLKPLCHHDSKKLFYKRIFGSEDGCHAELKEISEKILAKCGGVPLAINTIASLLANKPRNVSQWYSVHKSIGSGLDKSPSVENMRKVLSISYYGLPSHLKACLLYLSIFPEDYNILRDQLIRRWINEGFIPGEDVVTSYELGDNYFNELINRSMIQPEYFDRNGRVQICRVHDMVLDLITFLSYEENFFTAVPGQQSTNQANKIRRLALQSNADGHASLSAMNFSNVRSLIVFPSATSLLPLLSDFHVLRVLDLERCHDLDIHQLGGLMNLFHLRCLVLKDTRIEKLPKEIGNLSYLQTLDLRNTSISELPSTIVQLRQLLHLQIDKSVMLPNGFGNMKSLQVLSYIGISKTPNFIKELGNLTELRMLQISVSGRWYKSYEKPLTDSLRKLEKLHELGIHAHQVSTEFLSDFVWPLQHLKCFSGVQLSRLPRWINFSLLYLYTIDMTLNMLAQEDIQNLGSLKFLLNLRLSVLKIEGRLVIGIDHEEFKCLIKFSFASDAMRLIFAKRAMPSLENLELAFRVQDTKHFDLGFENLSSLKHATVRIDCRDSSIYEVEGADASMRKATFMNRNHPKLDVIRHFEDRMIRNDEKLQVRDETKEAEEGAMLVDKIGPWGGNGGHAYGITVASNRLESVTIYCGVVIDALAFSYWDRNGNRCTTCPWGGVGGSANKILFGASEYLMEVSGTSGRFREVTDVITSLTLTTNIRRYGPFGEPKGTPFCSQVKKGYNIVGFFGRSGGCLDALGVYIRPL